MRCSAIFRNLCVHLNLGTARHEETITEQQKATEANQNKQRTPVMAFVKCLPLAQGVQ